MSATPARRAAGGSRASACCPAPGETPFDGAIEMRDGRDPRPRPRPAPPAPGVGRESRPGMLALPGFVQGHVHLCQTPLARPGGGSRARPLAARADLAARGGPRRDDGARRRAARDRRVAARTAQRRCSTWAPSIDTDAIAEAAARVGVRIVLGNALMDIGDGVPARLRQDPAAAIAESLALHARWHGAARGTNPGRARAALHALGLASRSGATSPRSRGERDLLIHTHVSETPWENETCRAMHGGSPLEALERWGVLAARTLLVHAIWLEPHDAPPVAERRAGTRPLPGQQRQARLRDRRRRDLWSRAASRWR